MKLGGNTRSNFMLSLGLGTVFVFLSIYGTTYANGQTSNLNISSAESETSTANSVLQTENFDPFESVGPSNDAADNNPSQGDADTSRNTINDDTSITNDDTTNNNNDDATNNNNDDATNNNNDDATNNNNDESSNNNNDESSNNNNDDSSNNNNDDSSNNNNDHDDKDNSDSDNSSHEDKKSKDDKKFELPFP